MLKPRQQREGERQMLQLLSLPSELAHEFQGSARAVPGNVITDTHEIVA